MKSYDTYIFDLDGTLLNTLEDLFLSTNHALRTFHQPERTLEEVRQFVGNGVRKLIERAVPNGAAHPQFEEIFAEFKAYYQLHSEDHTAPYPGVCQLLEELKRRGKKTAVVSNKFLAATQQLCKQFFPDVIDVAMGEHEGVSCKPAPDMLRLVMKQLQATPDTTVYIGDSDVDLLTAQNTQLPCISVLWGFRDEEFLRQHGATCFVKTAAEILP